MAWRRRVVAWGGLALLLANLVVALGFGQRPMAAFEQSADGDVVMCTGHGPQAVPASSQPDTAPAGPDDRHASCVFCLPLCGGDASALAPADLALAVPAAASVGHALAADQTAVHRQDRRPRARAPPLAI